MKITAEFRFIDETETEKSEHAARLLAGSLSPDNMPNIRTEKGDGFSVITIESEKLSSVLATADDLLMNADTAVRVMNRSRSSRKQTDEKRYGSPYPGKRYGSVKRIAGSR